MRIKGIINIQNNGGSGTLLLQSLFDGHPQIISLPALYSREIFAFWDESLNKSDIKKLVDEFVADPRHAYWFVVDEKYKAASGNGLYAMGLNQNENVIINQDVFCSHLISILEKSPQITRKVFFEGTHIAYALTCNLKLSDEVYILFPFHSNPPKIANYIIEDFSDVKFIHMVREPIKCQDSGVKFELSYGGGRPLLWSSWLYDWGCRAIVDESKAKSIAVKLEDLHKFPKETMMSLFKWLQIDWNDCLMQSTFGRKKWWNRTGSIRQSGFGEATIKNELCFISKLDEIRLNLLFYGWKKRWKYPLQDYVEKKWFFYLNYYFLMLLPFKQEFLPRKTFLPIPNIQNNGYLIVILQPIIEEIKHQHKVSVNSFLNSLKLFLEGAGLFVANYVKLRQYIYRILNSQKHDHNFYLQYLDILEIKN